jgi:hypothetical protein
MGIFLAGLSTGTGLFIQYTKTGLIMNGQVQPG